MTIKKTDSQQTTCIATTEINGERRQVASATCAIRPGKSMNISIDLVEGVELSADDVAEMTGLFGAYLVEELKKAKALGIPIE